MQTHTLLGEQMLAGVASSRARGCGSSARTTSAGTARGYPDGLVRDEIPLGARIFAVADALDAITSDPALPRARGLDRGAEEIVGGAARSSTPTSSTRSASARARCARSGASSAAA